MNVIPAVYAFKFIYFKSTELKATDNSCSSAVCFNASVDI